MGDYRTFVGFLEFPTWAICFVFNVVEAVVSFMALFNATKFLLTKIDYYVNGWIVVRNVDIFLFLIACNTLCNSDFLNLFFFFCIIYNSFCKSSIYLHVLIVHLILQLGQRTASKILPPIKFAIFGQFLA